MKISKDSTHTHTHTHTHTLTHKLLEIINSVKLGDTKSYVPHMTQ